MEVDKMKFLNTPTQRLEYLVIKERIIANVYKISEKKGRSLIWECFGVVKDEYDNRIEGVTACKICNNVYRYNKHSLSNLSKHKCCQVLKIEKENDLITPPEEAQRASNEVLTEWILGDCRPYSLIADEGLKAYTKIVLTIGNKYGANVQIESLLPDPTTMCKSIEDHYSMHFEKLKKEISYINKIGYALTCDVWVDDLSTISYLAVTAHFVISGDFKNKLLSLKSLPLNLITSQDISREVNQILEDFDCNLSNNSILVSDSSNPLFKTIASTHHLPCMSHLLCDALFKSMAKVPEVLEVKNSCTDLVNYLTKKGHADILPGLVENSYRNSWIKVYKMLSSVEEHWSEIENILQDLNEKPRILLVNFNHLKAVVKSFQPFEEAIESLEDDSYATLHLVIVYLHELKKSCEADYEFQDFEFIEQLKEDLRTSLEKIETDHVTILHKLALFLYPPTNKLLQFKDEEKQIIEDECMRLMENYKNELKSVVKQENKSPNEATLSKRRKLFLDFVEPESNYVNKQFASEIQLYKSTRVLNSSDFDVFNWWQLQKDTFPFLYKLNCTVLATPATCAASKRILFKGKFFNEAKFEKILFVHSNARPEELDNNCSSLDDHDN